jgi:hypothetical protein
MQRPFFVTLAQLDPQRFIATCRNGLVHVTWGRTTVRFTRDEFPRLARLLEFAVDARPPATFRDGAVCITTRPDEDSELQLGPLVLLLPRDEFRRFVQTVQDAARGLDQFLAQGGFHDEPGEPEPGVLEQLRRPGFSKN